MVRVRFAPSPTGDLHLGSVRTALYCWLYAKKHAGKFILRIEDTDRERSTDAAVQIILDGMQWMGLNSDEGPFYQTQRNSRYQEVIQQMLASGTAYKCYCSKQRLEELREQQMQAKQKPRYDGYCLKHSAQKSDNYVVRFNNPKTGSVIIQDQIIGEVIFQNTELDDFIIARADGSPTYNFCVVVDDMDMQISHVVRGSDHLNNTPRQINVLTALGASIPKYAHLPMILGDDGKKLSKRHGSVSVLAYREQGYLPIAMRNYLLKLGWSYADQEIFSDQEMLELFDIKDVHRAAAAFNTKKLQWLNQHYLKTLSVEQIIPHLRWQLQNLGLNEQNGPELADLIKLQSERSVTLRDLVEKSRYFFEDVQLYDTKALQKHCKAEFYRAFVAVIQNLQQLSTWDKTAIHQVLVKIAKQHELKLGKIAQPIRIAVTGSTISPSIDATLTILGKNKTLQRLQRLSGKWLDK